MEERPFMQLAVDEAAKSRDEDDRPIHPKVGAVVVLGGRELARAHRGELGRGEHAEFTVLEKKLGTQSVAGATVFTTLEPCTERGFDKRPCAQWLMERRVGRVVIGTLDPNQDIRGKGEWALQEAGIQIGKFDPDLVRVLLDLNRNFIHYQAGLGIRITELVPAPGGDPDRFILRGTYNRHPLPHERIYGFVRRDSTYWPQSPATYVAASRQWECRISMGEKTEYAVYVARVSDDIETLIRLYYYFGRKYNEWVGQQWDRLPKGVQVLGEIAWRRE